MAVPKLCVAGVLTRDGRCVNPRWQVRCEEKPCPFPLKGICVSLCHVQKCNFVGEYKSFIFGLAPTRYDSVGCDGNAEPLGRRQKGKAMIALLATKEGLSSPSTPTKTMTKTVILV